MNFNESEISYVPEWTLWGARNIYEMTSHLITLCIIYYLLKILSVQNPIAFSEDLISPESQFEFLSQVAHVKESLIMLKEVLFLNVVVERNTE